MASQIFLETTASAFCNRFIPSSIIIGWEEERIVFSRGQFDCNIITDGPLRSVPGGADTQVPNFAERDYLLFCSETGRIFNDDLTGFGIDSNRLLSDLE
jgi:hypothetical protein